jgi:signal transduction histidine kinase
MQAQHPAGSCPDSDPGPVNLLKFPTRPAAPAGVGLIGVNLQPSRRHRKDPAEDSGGGTDPARGFLLLPEGRIAFVYVLLASIWIIGSDTLLSYLSGGDANLVFLQSFKGLNFVLTTGVLLYFVLRRAYGGWRRSEERRLAAMRSARERYRNLSSRVQTLREEERTRISREVHDELGQLLTGIKMQLRMIENQLCNRDDRTLNPLIDDLVESCAAIDESISSVRRIASGLRPLALDHLGIAAALDEEAEHFARRTGIQCNLKVEAIDRSIPPEIETAVFRIFQECLTNVARHAKASRVEARCGIRGRDFVLVVSDDGLGIGPAVIDKPESLGLVGMQERAADAGGFLEFKSGPGRGTEIVLTIPLEDEAVPSTSPPL